MDERLRRRGWWLLKGIRSRLRPSEREPSRALFVLGCQRSGTTMLVEALDKDWRVKTFGEYSGINLPAPHRRPWSVRSGSRYSIRMKPVSEVASTIERSRYPLVVCKPLVESQKARDILRTIDRATCVWVFRHYRSVARSNVELFTPEVTHINLEPILNGQRDNWRGELVPDDVRALVERHYAPDVNPFDGGALFWYARNRLFFDLDLAHEDRVVPLKYEDLASDPDRSLRAVYDHAGIAYPGDRVIADIHPRSIGLGQELPLSAEIEHACERLWVQLNDAYEERADAAVG